MQRQELPHIGSGRSLAVQANPCDVPPVVVDSYNNLIPLRNQIWQFMYAMYILRWSICLILIGTSHQWKFFQMGDNAWNTTIYLTLTRVHELANWRINQSPQRAPDHKLLLHACISSAPQIS